MNRFLKVLAGVVGAGLLFMIVGRLIGLEPGAAVGVGGTVFFLSGFVAVAAGSMGAFDRD